MEIPYLNIHIVPLNVNNPPIVLIISQGKCVINRQYSNVRLRTGWKSYISYESWYFWHKLNVKNTPSGLSTCDKGKRKKSCCCCFRGMFRNSLDVIFTVVLCRRVLRYAVCVHKNVHFCFIFNKPAFFFFSIAMENENEENFPVLTRESREHFQIFQLSLTNTAKLGVCRHTAFIHTDVLLSWGRQSKWKWKKKNWRKEKKNWTEKLNSQLTISATLQSLFRIWFDYMFSIAVGGYKNF